MKYFHLFLMVFGVFGIFLGCRPAHADITGYYYNWTGDTPPSNPFQGLPLLTRNDPNVDFNFDGVPAPAPIGGDKFAVRWHGLLRVPKGGHYTFYANTDDGARLYVNGAINIKEWKERGAPGFPGSAGTGVVLGAGWNDIVFEFYENGGAAVAQLNWNGPDFSEKQTIPASVLVPTNDLRVHIPMSVGGDGSASDYSGECHDGIIIGNPGFRTGRDGTINGAFTFDGATQYLKLANSKYVQLALADRGYTVSAWVYLTAFPSATNTVVVQNRGADTGPQRSLSLGFFASNMGASGDDVTSRVAFAVDGQSILIGAYTNPNVFALNEWHHLVGTWNGPGTSPVSSSQFKIYVDGVKMTTTGWGTGTAPVPPLLGSQPAEIGHHLAWNSFFPGSVDDVRIFDKELTQEEIARLHGGSTLEMGPYAGPFVTSMTRLSPSPVPANLSTIDYKVMFNQPVRTVAAGDFSVESLDEGGASADVLSVNDPSVKIGPLGFDSLGGGSLGGNDAALLSTGGQGDNGPCLQLTSNQGSKNGIWFIQSPAVAESFRASFSLFVNNPPNDHGADGFEFTYGANGNGGQGPEGPGGQGITVCFDTWNNDTESPGGSDGFPYSTSTSKPVNGAGLTYGNIVVKCNGQVVGNYVNYMRFESGEWIPVIIEVANNGAAGYMCNVYWGAPFTPSGTTTATPAGWTHCNVPLRGYAPAANWYFGIGAATGGANDLQLVDNLEIVSSDRTVSLNNMQGSGSLRMNLNDTDSTITNYENIPIAPNTWNGGETYFFDYTPPTVTISEPSSARTRSGPVAFTITYGEESNITLKPGDVTLNKTGSADGSVNVSGSGNTSRTVTISGITGDGTLGISIAPGTASDSLGNIALGAGPSAVFTVDNTGPSVQIGPPSALLTKSGPVSFTVTYTGADAVLLDPGDVTLNKTGTANGSVSVSGAGNLTRTVTLDNITGDGLLGISLAVGSAADDVGNPAPAAGPSAVFTTDNTGPGIWIGAPSSPLGTTGPITYAITYTEAVSISLSSTNVLLNRMGTANGSVSVSGTGNTTRTVTINGITGNGTLGISLLAGTALDELGNNALAMGPSLTFIVDNARPSCTVSTASASPTGIQPIVYQVVFNEPVYGLEPSEVTVSNGVVTGMTGGPAAYSVAVTPTGAPPTIVSVSLAQNMAQDAAGNQNMTSNTVAVSYDNAQPACAVTAPSAATNANPIPFTLQFNKSVTWVDASMIMVANGTKGALLGTGSSYTLPVTPLAQGAVTCEVLAGAARDATLNLNQASNLRSVLYDSVKPGCTVMGPVSPSNANPMELSLLFTEDVSGLTVDEIVVTNASKGSLAGSGMGPYTLPITPLGDGNVTCLIPENMASDAAGNGNSASALLTIQYDSAKPSCVVTGPPSPTQTAPIHFTLTFNEAVSVLDVSDIVIAGGVPGTILNTADNRIYTLDITPVGEGEVTCQVPATVAQDTAGNANTASNTANVTYASGKPTCIVSAPGAAIRANPILFTLTFSEPVSGLEEDEILLSNAARKTLSTADNLVFSLEVTPSGQGMVNCQVPADAAQDGESNGNTVSNLCATMFDSEEPSCTVSGIASTKSAPVEFTITFDEEVSEVLLEKILVTNGQKGIMSGEGAVYTIPVLPLGQGAVTCQVAAGAAWDAAGNGNIESNVGSTTFDSVRPKCTIMAPSGPVHTPPILFTINFDEPVTGLSTSHLKLTNATISGAMTGSGMGPYTLSVFPMMMGEVKCQVLEAAVQDMTQNDNLASGEASVYYDNPNPGCWISGPDSPAKDSPVLLNIHFSSPVTGLIAGEIAVTNGTKGTLSGAQMSYSLPVTPSAQGTMTCQVMADAAQDSGARGNTASNMYRIVYDSAPPAGTLALAGTTPTAADVLAFTMAFNEDVGDTFTAADITLHGTLAGLAAIGDVMKDGNTYTVLVTLNDPDQNGTVRISVGTAVNDRAGNAFGGAVSPEYRVRNWFGFVEQPVDTHVYLGGAGLFTAAASHGKGPVTYQWWRNIEGKAAEPIDGATQTLIILNPVTMADEGTYQCVATYDGVEFETDWASLAVAEHLRITKDLTGSGLYRIGSSLELKVEAEGGFQPLSYLWTQNGVEISNESELYMGYISGDDAGIYQVTVADAYMDDVEKSAEINVMVDLNTVPLAGLAGIAALTGLLALLGARRHRKQ